MATSIRQTLKEVDNIGIDYLSGRQDITDIKFKDCDNFRVFFFFPPAPSRAPNFLIIHISSSTSLVVEWSQLPEDYFQGKLIGYDVTYYPADSEREINRLSVHFGMNTTTLVNLTVYTLYVINVSAVSSAGIGPASTIQARTGAEGTGGLSFL